MLAMFIWTVIVMLRNVQVRLSALRRGKLNNEYFELFRGAEPSAVVVKTGNPLRNLTELPPSILHHKPRSHDDRSHRRRVHGTRVELRAAPCMSHIVHLTINKVPVRFLFFFLSNVALMVMWVRLGLTL
jgi:hypothetical protein